MDDEFFIVDQSLEQQRRETHISREEFLFRLDSAMVEWTIRFPVRYTKQRWPSYRTMWHANANSVDLTVLSYVRRSLRSLRKPEEFQLHFLLTILYFFVCQRKYIDGSSLIGTQPRPIVHSDRHFRHGWDRRIFLASTFVHSSILLRRVSIESRTMHFLFRVSTRWTYKVIIVDRMISIFNQIGLFQKSNAKSDSLSQSSLDQQCLLTVENVQQESRDIWPDSIERSSHLEWSTMTRWNRVLRQVEAMSRDLTRVGNRYSLNRSAFSWLITFTEEMAKTSVRIASARTRWLPSCNIVF